MYSASILTTLLTLLAATTAAPTTTLPLHQTQYYGVSIGIIVSPGLSPNKTLEPAPVPINVLTACYGTASQDVGCSVSELIVQNGTASGVDIEMVECRAYKDFAGVVPGSAAFNVNSPALVSTNLATVSSLLCESSSLP